jgi:hypothetical protein
LNAELEVLPGDPKGLVMELARRDVTRAGLALSGNGAPKTEEVAMIFVAAAANEREGGNR